MNRRPGKNSHPGAVVYAAAGTDPPLALPAKSRVWWIALTIPCALLLLIGCSSQPSAESVDKGRELTYDRCTTCHNARTFEKHRYSRAEWVSVIQRMMKHGAQFTPEEQDLIADFLGAKFGR